MTTTTQPTILVIVGISGDLSKRYLLPAIRQISRAGALPEAFKIVGVSRRELAVHDVLPPGDNDELKKMIEVYQMDLADPQAYHKLDTHLKSIEHQLGGNAQRLFYLSVPPQVTQGIVGMLGQAGMLKSPDAKLLLEKPFGTDLASAYELVDHLNEHADEAQVYRIDHFVAKEMAQNLIVFRAGNPLIKGTWNKDFIESVEVYAGEDIGIEGRVAFYEQTGALRDMVQSHLLQLAALVLMDLPDIGAVRDIPAKRLHALEALDPPEDLQKDVQRGQYAGYRQEVGNPGSTVETYVSLKLFSRDPRWEGVPVTLTTGKALEASATEIRLTYRQQDAAHTNKLVLRIHPHEGVTLHFWVKRPGYDYEMQPLPLVLSYENHFAGLPAAYERVFIDAMRSERALFTTSQEVLAAWRLIEPIQHAWSMSDGHDLLIYQPGQAPLGS
jgi:glucose-6-phosphate 1-dehydrogenase